jgi:hypothetical protein
VKSERKFFYRTRAWTIRRGGLRPGSGWSPWQGPG